MIIILLPLLVCLVGWVIWWVSKTPKMEETGRIMFWVGLFVTLLGSKGVIEVLSK